MQDCVESQNGTLDYFRPVCFEFERARAPRHFLFGKGHPMRKFKISTGAFQGHQGNGIRPATASSGTSFYIALFDNNIDKRQTYK